MIRVSVIVPVYRAESYIARCARSILGQTYPHTQFIFVDDGSPDGSVEILNELIDKEFPDKKERILVLRGENGGALKARLDGLARAEGDYILFVDADDWLEPDAVGSLAAEAERAARTSSSTISGRSIPPAASWTGSGTTPRRPGRNT